MRIVYWGLIAITALVLVLFAVSNRAAVSVGLWPLPAVAEVPIFALVLAPLVVGVIAGRLAAWFAGGRRRRESRRRSRRIEALERELAATQALLEERTAPAPPRLPVSG